MQPRWRTRRQREAHHAPRPRAHPPAGANGRTRRRYSCARHRLAVDDQPTAYAGAEDDAQHRRVAAKLVVRASDSAKQLASLSTRTSRPISAARSCGSGRPIAAGTLAVNNVPSSSLGRPGCRCRRYRAGRKTHPPQGSDRTAWPAAAGNLHAASAPAFAKCVAGCRRTPQLNLGAAHIETVVHNPSRAKNGAASLPPRGFYCPLSTRAGSMRLARPAGYQLANRLSTMAVASTISTSSQCSSEGRKSMK